MGCSCKQSPLERTERKIQYWGWQKLAPSDIRVVDNFIFSKLEKYPNSMEERISFYGEAKSIKA